MKIIYLLFILTNTMFLIDIFCWKQKYFIIVKVSQQKKSKYYIHILCGQKLKKILNVIKLFLEYI